MWLSFTIWKLIAGVAIFLLGMSFLEEALQQLIGRPFKLFLKKQTGSKWKAMAGGGIVTAVLQSSSVVNLMVLAFTGAGVITVQNAMAVIMGANLGTTLDSWLVAWLGFKMNIESIALPVTGIAGIIMMLTDKETKWNRWSRFFFGLSFLFLGLNYMKTAIEESVKSIDFNLISHYSPLVFLVIGFLITALIQSSLATVAIVLSALHANAIGLPAATAIVLGAEIGTSVKLLLAATKGMAAKRRVALGNFLFNLITVAIVFIFLYPLNKLLTDILGIKDNLTALVLFQSLVNIIGIIIFYPFLGAFGRFLEKRFTDHGNEPLFISNAGFADADIALDALEKESGHFLHRIINFQLDSFGLKEEMPVTGFPYRVKGTLQEQYNFIKHLHGDLHTYCIQLQKNIAGKPGTERVAQLAACIRNGMYAAKSIKDALADTDQLRNSSNDIKYNFYLHTRTKVMEISTKALSLLQQQDSSLYFEKLSALYETVTKGYNDALRELYKEGMQKLISEEEISTLINFNRQIHTAFKSLLFAMKDNLLTTEQADYFDELPGFIR